MVKAVILAGGKGTRLRPYTTSFPKPLMPIGNKPVLEIIVRQLKSQGIDQIVMMVGYLSELIMAYFGNGGRFGVDITYSKEEQPLGTVGGLSLISDVLDDTFLMINGDTLTSLNFLDLIRQHDNSRAIATVALKERQTTVDFGVVELNGNNEVAEYREKPTLVSLVSTGVNVMSPRVLDYIEFSQYLDFPTLVRKLVSNGQTVKGYVFDGYWLDIGRPDDYEKANDEISKIYPILGVAEDDAYE